jgi:Folylpolyglutamate synthase
MAEYLSTYDQRCSMILGLQPHKDAPGYLAHVASYLDKLIQVPADIGLPVNDMAHDVPSQTLGSWEEAVRLLYQEKPQAPLVLCGSLYLAGLILKKIS